MQAMEQTCELEPRRVKNERNRFVIIEFIQPTTIFLSIFYYSVCLCRDVPQ